MTDSIPYQPPFPGSEPAPAPPSPSVTPFSTPANSSSPMTSPITAAPPTSPPTPASNSAHSSKPLLLTIILALGITGITALIYWRNNLPPPTPLPTTTPSSTSEAQASPTPSPITTQLDLSQGCNSQNTIGVLQTWNECTNYATPAANQFTTIGCLQDSRDQKAYEVRKFADGKCWLADNLAYGGTPDQCQQKTIFNGLSAQTGRPWGFGDCLAEAISSTNSGYLYNWQAAMQHFTAGFATDYTGITTAVTGICPTGWHLPSLTEEFVALATANPTTPITPTSSASANLTPNFWQPSGSFKTPANQIISNETGVILANTAGWWSTDEESSFSAFVYTPNMQLLLPQHNVSYKRHGLAIRCVKN